MEAEKDERTPLTAIRLAQHEGMVVEQALGGDILIVDSVKNVHVRITWHNNAICIIPSGSGELLPTGMLGEPGYRLVNRFRRPGSGQRPEDT